jgi:hypothetical protein
VVDEPALDRTGEAEKTVDGLSTTFSAQGNKRASGERLGEPNRTAHDDRVQDLLDELEGIMKRGARALEGEAFKPGEEGKLHDLKRSIIQELHHLAPEVDVTKRGKTEPELAVTTEPDPAPPVEHSEGAPATPTGPLSTDEEAK